MTRRNILVLSASSFRLFAQKKSQSKGPEILILEATAHKEEGNLVVDGRVRIAGERPIRRLSIVIDILDSDHHLLTRQKGGVDDGELSPGEEAEFSTQMSWHARAIYYRLGFEDANESELRIDKPGPFPIE